MGSWGDWQDLGPLVEVTKTHVDPATQKQLEQVRKLLGEGKARSADEILSGLSNSAARQWVAVARGNLAAIHFTTCIRGVAWRLEDLDLKEPVQRRMDFSEETKVAPGDISVEALLTNLDDAMQAKVEALAIQARVARARVSAWAARCAANPDVARMAQEAVESDLATLAAEGHLTPDLAYVWAGIQMSRYSGSAARPFLMQAKEGGFDNPAVTYMLAVISLEQRDLDQADALAVECVEAFTELGDTMQAAQSHFIRGEVAKARNDPKTAVGHYEKARTTMPTHVAAIVSVAEIRGKDRGEDAAVDYIAASLGALTLDGKLDVEQSREAASNLEALVMLAEDPYTASISRDALLQSIDAEPDPTRRGLRYFYAATLEVRLGEYDVARGHAVLARDEFAEVEQLPPVNVDEFLGQLGSAG